MLINECDSSMTVLRTSSILLKMPLVFAINEK